jgi:transcription elongation factor Elf1
MNRPPSDLPEITGRHSIISMSLGGHAVLQQLETTLTCTACGRDTLHHILYLGQRIAEVRCVECGRCIGMDREEVIRAFIGEIVIQVLRLPREMTREFRRDPGKVVVALPRQMAKLPLVLAQDAVRLLRVVRGLREDPEGVEDFFSQVDTTLFCPTCGRETAHRILYLGRRLAEARCEGCGRGVGMTREEVFSDFVGEAVLHLLKLPHHVRRELRRDFAHAVQTLPRQMMRMPFHLARDFIQLVRILRGPRKVGETPGRRDVPTPRP